MNPQRSPAQIVSGIFGFMMFAVSAPCVIGMIHDLITQADNIQGALIAGTFFGFIGIAGVFMMMFALKKPQQRAVTETLERKVLSVAQAHGGRITIAELAVASDLSLGEASRVLRHFEHQEACRTHLSNDGDIVYVFPGFTMDKSKAVDPLNDAAMFDAALGNFEDEVEFGTDGEVGEADVQEQATTKASQESW